MTVNMSTYLADKLLDHSLGHTSYTMPTVYVLLYTTDPTMPAATGGVEVATGSYARVALSGLIGAAASGSAANTGAIAFPAATADWGTIVAVGLADASTGGNILKAGPLAASKVVSNGDSFSIPIGDLVDALA